MSTAHITKPSHSAQTESKSARKKKAKAELAAATAAAVSPPPTKDGHASIEGSANDADDADHPHIRSLQKKLRNVNKRISAIDKVDSVRKENPDATLDELVTSKKINNDQKAQALKKPQLEIERDLLDGQISQFKSFRDDVVGEMNRKEESIKVAHAKELEELERRTRADERAEADRNAENGLLIFSQFLRSAAARRQQGDEETELSKAFEGVLLHVYGGNADAVVAANKLVSGSDEHVTSTEGHELRVSYAQVKQASIDDAPFAAEEAWVDEVAKAADASSPDEEVTAATDPTVAHAGLTELDALPATMNGDSAAQDSAVPTASVDDIAANVAGGRWDIKPPGSEDTLAESFEMIPRDPVETEAAPEPAAVASTQSWAEETTAAASSPVDHATPVAPAAPDVTNAAPTTNGDGFQEVSSSRGGRGRGHFHGERRSSHRGRGPRGDGRGRGGYRGGDGYRGRGGYRGSRGRENHQAQPSQ